MDHCRMDHRFAGCRQQPVILTQASVAIEPPEGALHNPTFGDDHEPLDGIGPLRHLQAEWPLGPQRPHPVHRRSGIGPISPDVPEPPILMPEDLEELFRASTVLHTGGCHHHGEDQPKGIDEETTLAPLDLLARVIAADPPGSVVLTD
jgi:hypothetical protein